MCCICCRPSATHNATGVMLAVAGVGTGAIGVTIAAAWLAGVITAIAPVLAVLLVLTVAGEIAVPAYYALRDSGNRTPGEYAREVRRAIAHDVARIRIARARRAAALEAARAPIATPYAIPSSTPERTEEVARGRQ